MVVARWVRDLWVGWWEGDGDCQTDTRRKSDGWVAVLPRGAHTAEGLVQRAAHQAQAFDLTGHYWS